MSPENPPSEPAVGSAEEERAALLRRIDARLAKPKQENDKDGNPMMWTESGWVRIPKL